MTPLGDMRGLQLIGGRTGGHPGGTTLPVSGGDKKQGRDGGPCGRGREKSAGEALVGKTDLTEKCTVSRRHGGSGGRESQENRQVGNSTRLERNGLSSAKSIKSCVYRRAVSGLRDKSLHKRENGRLPGEFSKARWDLLSVELEPVNRR